jgi:hypothetical protein
MAIDSYRIFDTTDYAKTIYFFTSLGVPVIPTSMVYRIDDITSGLDTEILDDTTVYPTGTSYTIDVSAALNGLVSASHTLEKRLITIEYFYGGSARNVAYDSYEVQKRLGTLFAASSYTYDPTATSDYGDDLNAAVAAIGSVPTTLYIDGVASLTANLIVPSNVHIIDTKEGYILQTGAFTLAINGPFTGYGDVAFSGFSAGQVTFGNGIEWVIPEWWGANTTPGTTNMTTAIQSALDTTKEVRLSKTTYAFTSIDIGPNERLIGSGWGCIGQDAFAHANWSNLTYCSGTILKCTSTTLNAITFGTTSHIWGTQIKDILIVGPGSGTTIGINASVDTGATYYVQNNYGFLDNVGVVNFATGILFDSFITNSWYDVNVRGCTTGIVFGDTSPCTDIKSYNIEVQHCATGIEFKYIDGISFFGGLVQGNTLGLKFNPTGAGYVYDVQLYGVWFEANTKSWGLSNGTNGISHIKFDSCRESTAWTWTLTDGDIINNISFDNCYFTNITIDFSGFSTGGATYWWTARNTRFYAITGLPTAYSQFFSGDNILLESPSRTIGLKGIGNSVIHSYEAPTTQAWKKGDICWNSIPDATEWIGWICVSAGTPGTWKGFGVIDT